MARFITESDTVGRGLEFRFIGTQCRDGITALFKGPDIDLE